MRELRESPTHVHVVMSSVAQEHDDPPCGSVGIPARTLLEKIVKNQGAANVAQIGEFEEIIDVRSPAEFAEDHLPCAINCPVLDNEQRIRVGTLYKQDSPFAAKRIGAALVARNIAAHIESRFLDKPRAWRPLLYCWRGGKRSGAFTHVLRQIGWDAHQLVGGYKAYRRLVVAQLEDLPQRFSYRVVCGATGSGKSRLLLALASEGGQVLDLEALAAHKGSVLGDLPDEAQPSQKMFESRIYSSLKSLQTHRPVFVEAESRKIGALQVPDVLLAAMRASPCVCIAAGTHARVRYLLEDYAYLMNDATRLKAKLDCLLGVQSGTTLRRWHALVDDRSWAALVTELLEVHYDPLYIRSQGKNYIQYAQAPSFYATDLGPEALVDLASRILEA